ncbi:hypothetical protein E4U39_005412 [Claviceps sp. Clav50 group G5]|nr:hypothetical protein E4U39_005412 [Claviceps sp. Clav50 group G5]
MDTPSPDYDSESLSYQTGLYENDDGEFSLAEAFSEYPFDDSLMRKKHAEPIGPPAIVILGSRLKMHLLDTYAQSLLKSPDHIFKQVLQVTKIQFSFIAL